ncbi:MAG: helix-turn-helix domain-containing protein [Roseburia sp.]|nr:helix-turn-helix domain-containing protein [Roseburia sp.]
MGDIGTKEAAKRWNVTQQTVQIWCREGKISGATQDKKGSPWHIPRDAQRPN